LDYFLQVSSCKKDEVSLSKTQLLTGTTWKLSKLTFLGDDESPTESCEKDNTVNDSIDEKYLEKEGATKCNPALT
jgi:hypothetical protein